MLSILGIVAIVVITIQVYKTASGTDRNAAAWAAIAAVIGIGIQFVLPIFIGFAIGLYLAMTGSDMSALQTGLFGLMTFISIVGVVLSIGGMWLVARHVATVKDDDVAGSQPPPPPTFGS